MEIEEEDGPGGRFSVRLRAAEFIIIVQCSCGMDCTRRDGNLVEFVSYTIDAEVRVRAMDRILYQHARYDLPSRILLGVLFTALAGWLSFVTIQAFSPRPGHFENMTTMLALLVGGVAGERFGAFLPAWVAVRALERERVEAVGSAGERLWGACLHRLADITQPYEKL